MIILLLLLQWVIVGGQGQCGRCGQSQIKAIHVTTWRDLNQEALESDIYAYEALHLRGDIFLRVQMPNCIKVTFW